MQIAEHIAKKGKQIGFMSLEMPDTQLIQKMVSRIGQVDSHRLKAGTLEESDFDKMAKIFGEIKELPITVISKVRTIQDIEVKTRQLKNRDELDVLFIDYLQLVKSSGRFGSREQEVAEISRTLKLLSLELEIPVVALCQLNRNATRNEPTLADLRESGAIEQDADNVIFLYQEEGQEEEKTPTVIAKVAKQRTGDVGKIKLRFNKANSEFVSLIR